MDEVQQQQQQPPQRSLDWRFPDDALPDDAKEPSIATEATLQQVEAALGVSLPAGFRQVVVQHSGQMPQLRRFFHYYDPNAGSEVATAMGPLYRLLPNPSASSSSKDGQETTDSKKKPTPDICSAFSELKDILNEPKLVPFCEVRLWNNTPPLECMHAGDLQHSPKKKQTG